MLSSSSCVKFNPDENDIRLFKKKIIKKNKNNYYLYWEWTADIELNINIREVHKKYRKGYETSRVYLMYTL